MALLLAMLSVSNVPYVGVAMAYDAFFALQPAQRRALVHARLSLVHLEIHARPKVENVAYVLDRLLVHEGVGLVFGFLNVVRKNGAGHVVPFTVCDRTSIIMCDNGTCASRGYDEQLRFQKYRVRGLVLAVHGARAAQVHRPFTQSLTL